MPTGFPTLNWVEAKTGWKGYITNSYSLRYIVPNVKFSRVLRPFGPVSGDKSPSWGQNRIFLPFFYFPKREKNPVFVHFLSFFKKIAKKIVKFAFFRENLFWPQLATTASKIDFFHENSAKFARKSPFSRVPVVKIDFAKSWSKKCPLFDDSALTDGKFFVLNRGLKFSTVFALLSLTFPMSETMWEVRPPKGVNFTTFLVKSREISRKWHFSTFFSENREIPEIANFAIFSDVFAISHFCHFLLNPGFKKYSWQRI